MLTIM